MRHGAQASSAGNRPSSLRTLYFRCNALNLCLSFSTDRTPPTPRRATRSSCPAAGPYCSCCARINSGETGEFFLQFVFAILSKSNVGGAHACAARRRGHGAGGAGRSAERRAQRRAQAAGVDAGRGGLVGGAPRRDCRAGGDGRGARDDDGRGGGGDEHGAGDGRRDGAGDVRGQGGGGRAGGAAAALSGGRRPWGRTQVRGASGRGSAPSCPAGGDGRGAPRDDSRGGGGDKHRADDGRRDGLVTYEDRGEVVHLAAAHRRRHDQLSNAH